ncbi:MAG: DNA-3-methyladenine glycosylase [Armatimonadetes bacterium]|nr:DNA-3-methyladenine glycosylase [Armatimonadota bacterium]
MPKLCSLPAGFYDRDPADVARDLLGTWLVHHSPEGPAGGIIVETEAYRGQHVDPASHAYRRKTPRNRTMFEQGGRAYVYFIYGNHFCLNVVAHPAGEAGAVLLRALEPRVGLELMARRRRLEKPAQLSSGPGKLCQALGIGREHNGAPFLPPESGRGLILGRAAAVGCGISCGPRIGVRAGADELLRFWAAGNPHVSRGRA